MRSRLPSKIFLALSFIQRSKAFSNLRHRHGLNFIKLDGDIGCLGMGPSKSTDKNYANGPP